MRRIRVNGEGDGAWVMDQVDGTFLPGSDQSLMATRDHARLGGFVLSAYLGASMTVHMAGTDPRWCSRDLLWMVFHYAFVQLGLRKLIAPVASTNHVALAQDLRAGFRLEATLRDATPDGHLLLLTMTREDCRWLRIKPSRYKDAQQALEQ